MSVSKAVSSVQPLARLYLSDQQRPVEACSVVTVCICLRRTVADLQEPLAGTDGVSVLVCGLPSPF